MSDTQLTRTILSLNSLPRHSKSFYDVPSAAPGNDRGPELVEEASETFRVEDGHESEPNPNREAFMSQVLLENPEAETRWYFKYFLGKEHHNYLTFLQHSEEEKELVVLSVLNDSKGTLMRSAEGSASCRAILWRKTGSERLALPYKGKMPENKKILASFGHGLALSEKKMFIEVKDPNIQRDLGVLEEQEGAVNFKIGILYRVAGQLTDDEMFSNKSGSHGFDEFCRSMGSLVQLHGFKQYRGGLDVKNNSTGEMSIHTTEYGKEIMFHVSTLLPYSPDNPQQLERKRHLGNDICNIIFQDGVDETFTPDMIKSKFNHIFALVMRDPNHNYHLKVYTRCSVPAYGPSLPNPAIFSSLDDLKRFLVVKLLNGEKSALDAPHTSFAHKRVRTLDLLIQQIHLNYDTSGKLLKYIGFPVARVSPKLQKKKKEGVIDSETFRSKGQSIKMHHVANGTAPTSSLGVIFSKAEPWSPIAITSSFKHPVLCGDIWGSNLVVGTPQGIYEITIAAHKPGELKTRLLVDSTISPTNIVIDEDIDMLYALSSKSDDDEISSHAKRGRSGNLYAIPLSALRHITTPLSKKQYKPHLVSKGVSCFAINLASLSLELSPGLKFANLALCVGKKIRTMMFLARNPGMIPGMGEGGEFHTLNDLPVENAPETMSFVSSTGSKKLCVGFSGGEFDLLDVETGESHVLLPRSLLKKAEPVAGFEIPSSSPDRGAELVLCSNQHIKFRHLDGSDSRGFDVNLTMRPDNIACVPPYLLGFTPDGIDVFTLRNGSLIKSLPIPSPSMICRRKDIFFIARVNEKASIFKISELGLSGKIAPENLEGLTNGQYSPLLVRKLSHFVDVLSSPEGSMSLPLPPISPMSPVVEDCDEENVLEEEDDEDYVKKL